MRLEFTILWIDDQPKHIESFSDGLRMRLQEKGFKLRVKGVQQLKDIPAEIGDHVHNDSIDLVLVDYDLGLGGGKGGEDALKEVRQHFPYKEVVFYSATDVKKLRKVAFDAGVDGVNFSTRLSLVDDTLQVIEKLLCKVLDLDHMRGIVMSASSDIDDLVERILATVYENLGEEERKAFLGKLVEQLAKKLMKWEDDLRKAEENGDMRAFLRLKHLFTAFDRLGALIERLEEGWAADGSTHLEMAKQYKEDIVPRRNKLAHLMLKREDGKPPELVGADGSWKPEDMTALRRDFIEHRENFVNIAVLLDVDFS